MPSIFRNTNGELYWKSYYEEWFHYAKGLESTNDELQQTSRKEVEELSVQVKKKQRQLEQALDDAARKDVLYKARTADLQAARTFLKTTDTLSGADIVHKVEELNTQIHQTASFVSDSVEYTQERSTGTDGMNPAFDWYYKQLGSILNQMLLRNNHTEDPISVQWAMQTAMLYFCNELVLGWCSSEPDLEAKLVRIYQAIQDHELPFVAKQWQTLTRRQLRLMEPPSASNALNAIISRLEVILLVAGCNKNRIHNMFGEKFEGSLTKIVDLAMKLRIAVSEEVSSMDIVLVSASSGEAFDRATMDTDYPISDSDVRHVLCTIGLGVEVIETERGDGDTWIRKNSMLLKPKVVFIEEQMVESQKHSGGVLEEVQPNEINQTSQNVRGVQVEDAVTLNSDHGKCDEVEGKGEEASDMHMGNFQERKSEELEAGEKSNVVMEDQIDSKVQKPMARDDGLKASDSTRQRSPTRSRTSHADKHTTTISKNKQDSKHTRTPSTNKSDRTTTLDKGKRVTDQATGARTRRPSENSQTARITLNKGERVTEQASKARIRRPSEDGQTARKGERVTDQASKARNQPPNETSRTARYSSGGRQTSGGSRPGQSPR